MTRARVIGPVGGWSDGGSIGAPSAPAPGARSPAVVRWLMILSVIVAVGIFAVGALVLLDGRADAWQAAETTADNLSIVITRDIARDIAAYDLSMRATVAALQIPGIDQASPALRQAALFDRGTTAAYSRPLLVIDAAGHIVFDSSTLDHRGGNFADREDFIGQRDQPGLGLYIGRPVPSRRYAADGILPLSRRRDDANGGFAGIVRGGLRLSYFQDLFERLNLDPTTTIMLRSADCRVIARQPFKASDIGLDLSKAATCPAMKAARSGRFVAHSEMDKFPRLYTFRHVGGFPLVLSVGIAVDEIEAPWRHKATAIGAVLVGLCAATLLLGQLFRREMRRRVTAETGLVTATADLFALSRTDGLTGLGNRRAFDDGLDRHWRRASDRQSPISLLMIDADGFKRYNDTYGHQEGDRVLQAIAGGIRRNIRAGCDIAARYGGEEFAVVLSDTEIEGAARIAERIRAAIAGLAIPHAGAMSGHVSVSIGLAMARPRDGELSYHLVKQADEALFHAKQQGRDRVCLADERVIIF